MYNLRIASGNIILTRLIGNNKARISWAKLYLTLILINVLKFGISKRDWPSVFAEYSIIFLLRVHSVIESDSTLMLWSLYFLPNIEEESGLLHILLNFQVALDSI